jgi:hypothetical protein
MHALAVSMTLVRNFLPVLLTSVKLSKTVKVSLTGVVDTGEAPKQSNISANIQQKSKSLLGLFTGARRSCLKKKTRGKNLVALSL